MRKDASCLSSGDDITVSSPNPFRWRIYEFGKLYDENETTSFALAGDTPKHDNIARERMVNELAEAMINDAFMAIAGIGKISNSIGYSCKDRSGIYHRPNGLNWRIPPLIRRESCIGAKSGAALGTDRLSYVNYDLPMRQ